MELLHSFKFRHFELNLYDHENFEEYLFELKINGSTNAVGFSDVFDFTSCNPNYAVARFHELTKGIYMDEIKQLKKVRFK